MKREDIKSLFITTPYISGEKKKVTEAKTRQSIASKIVRLFSRHL